MQILYEQGARKVAIFGVGSIGCTPYARANFEHIGLPCVDKINTAIQLFNAGLKSLVEHLNANLPSAKFTFIDVFKISTVDPLNYGNFSYKFFFLFFNLNHREITQVSNMNLISIHLLN